MPLIPLKYATSEKKREKQTYTRTSARLDVPDFVFRFLTYFCLVFYPWPFNLFSNISYWVLLVVLLLLDHIKLGGGQDGCMIGETYDCQNSAKFT